MLPELWRRGEREHSNQEVQSRGPRQGAAREKPLLHPLWRAAHGREVIVAMDMARTLAVIHRRVRAVLAETPPDLTEPVATASGELNPKGDVQQLFDLAADKLIRQELEALCASGVMLSEERAEGIIFGRQPPRYRFVVDPVDGSDNHRRSLPLAAVSVAVLDGEGPLGLEEVMYALVGGLDEEEPMLGTRRQRAWQGTVRLKTSGVRRIEDAFVSCELNHWAPDRRLAEILRRSRGIRTYGCASRAIALVARGALDAHIDVRDRLTPESFLAASLLLTEAGGYACRPDGSPLGPFSSIRERTGLIAAAGEDLALAIVAALSA